MPQVIRETTAGGNLSEALGSGLSEGLEYLARQKINSLTAEKSRQQSLSGLSALGYNPQEAEAISYLPPDIQKIAISEKVKRPDQQFSQDLNQLLGYGEPGVPQGIAGQQESNQNVPATSSAFKREQGVPAGIEQQKESGKPKKPKIPANLSVSDQLKVAKFLNDQKKENANQEKAGKSALEPYLKGRSEDYTNGKKIKSIAETMLTNLKKHKNKWPTGLGRFIPDQIRSDKDLSKYALDANKLVLELAQSRKGNPTNFKTRLEQLAKPNLSQPIETQIEALNDIIKTADQSIGSYQKLLDLKKQHGGKFPSDVRERLLEGEFEAKEGEQAAELTHYAGSDVVQDESGTLYKWDPSQNRYRPAKQRG